MIVTSPFEGIEMILGRTFEASVGSDVERL
jgi:hypothetical protein